MSGYTWNRTSAAILGPVPGIIVGALSNIITGLIYSVSDIPFCLVNMAVGLIVGLVAKMEIRNHSCGNYRCCT
ncbi:MAG: ECF transporter S component [Dorea sp.]